MSARPEKLKTKTGSALGLLITVAVGFILYFVLQAIGEIKLLPTYGEITSNINGYGKFLWYIMNWTEGDFYAGIFTSIALVAGCFISFFLSRKGSKAGGIAICYGDVNIFPWVFAGQALALAISVFGLNHVKWLSEGVSWLPTFLCVVNIPACFILMYGKNIPSLITASLFGGFFAPPIAYWFGQTLVGQFGAPGVAGNVAGMAMGAVICGCFMNIMPFCKKEPVKKPDVMPPMPNPYSASYNIRRTLADLTEPPFYGNDLAGFCLMIGLFLDWIFGRGILCDGGFQAIPTIVLAQFVGAGVSIWLYAGKYEERGWYPTYITPAAVAPACVLVHGATIPVALYAAILSAIISPPLAEFIADRLPDYLPGTIANTSTMAIIAILISASIYLIPFI